MKKVLFLLFFMFLVPAIALSSGGVQKIPYIDFSGDIVPGIVVTNNTGQRVTAEAKVYALLGGDVLRALHARTLYKDLLPWESWTPYQPELFGGHGRFSLLVYGDVSINAATVTLKNGQIEGFGFLPATVKLNRLSDIIYPQNELAKTSIEKESAFYYWLGDCGYMRSAHLQVLELIASKICNDYPDRQDRRLCIYDSVPQDDTDCPGHSPSHNGQKAVDFDTGYYTFGTNSTQARGTVTEIWTDRNSPTSTLIPGVFDLQRNTEFFKLIFKCFPNAQITVDYRIRDALIAYDPEMKKLTQCAAMQNKHHLHPHIRFSGLTGEPTINWNVEF